MELNVLEEYTSAVQRMAKEGKGEKGMKKEMKKHEEEISRLEKYNLFLERKYGG